MASTLFFLFALAVSAAARPSNISSVFPGGQLDDRIYQNSPYILDDMRFVDWQLGKDKAVATSNITLRWPNGRVPFFIGLPLALNLTSVQLIRAAMDHITMKTGGCIKFDRLLLQPLPLVRMNYVRVFNGTGCFAHVGMVGGQQQLSLGRGCLFKGTIVHELCHALGFFHEQNRSDRDDFITVNMNNIQPDAQSQFVKLSADQEIKSTFYDYFSIMQYGAFAFSKNKLPTMTPNPPNESIILQNPDKKDGLTQMDIDMIKRMYSC